MESNKNAEYNRNLSQQDIEDKVQQFYRKPENQGEMVEALKILRDIPDDISDPKVIIKLGNPRGEHKVVLMSDEEGRKYIIALPIEKKAYHRDIANFARKFYGKDLTVLGGGYIKSKDGKLVVYGTSESFGEASKRELKEILKIKFPDIEIEAVPLSEQKAVDNDERLKCVLKNLKTATEKDLYGQVVSKEAVRMGHDMAYKPVRVEGSEDMHYMIYKSENGRSFGVDTLFLGYKDGQVIKIKELIQSRWFLNIKEASVQGGNLRIAYESDQKPDIIDVPIDKIEELQVKSTLNEAEQIILKMYKDNRDINNKERMFHM